jgi:actin-related protein
VYFTERQSDGFKGTHNLISQSLEKCEADQRKDLIPNIQLIGGGSSFATTPERLQKELMETDFLGMGSKMKVFTTNEKSERSISSWLGATIMGSMKMFDKFIISRKEYEDHGAAHVEKRL